MDITRTISVLAVITALGTLPAHAQQWDTSKLQKNRQTPIKRTSGGMKFPYTVSKQSAAAEQEVAPAPTQQWDDSKLQTNVQTPTQGRFGGPNFQYVPARPTVTPEKEAAPAGTELKPGAPYGTEESGQTGVEQENE